MSGSSCVADALYFRNYEEWPMPWKMAMGEGVVIILKRGADTWTPFSAVRLNVTGHHIDRIRETKMSNA